jgi:hypothetical protein
MNDRITTTLTESMRQIVDIAPDPPSLPQVDRSARRRGSLAAFAWGFAAVVVVGIVTALLVGPGSDGVGSGDSTPSPPGTVAVPVTTAPPNVTATISPPEEENARPATLEEIAAYLDATPMTDAELSAVTGLPSGSAADGYRLNRVLSGETGAELGLILYRDLAVGGEEQPALICLHDYARIGGTYVAGGAQCAPTPERAAEMAAFGIAGSGACGPHPKDDPQLDGVWTLLTLWGIPREVDTVTVGLGDGSSVSVEVSATGVAQQLWESAEAVASVRFDGMTSTQADWLERFLPSTAIDCAAS